MGTGVTPYGAVQYQNWRLPSYSETTVSGASDFAVAVNGRNAVNTRFEAGAWVDRTFDTPYGRLQMRGRLAWLHEMRSAALIKAAFPALPGSNFSVTGASGDPNALLVSYGAEMRIPGGWSVGTKFDGELAQNSQTYAGTGTLRYRW